MENRQITYSEKEIDVNDAQDVMMSFGRASISGDFIGRFYEIFLESEPSIKPIFKNTDFSKQKGLLKQGISLIILYAKGSVVGTSGLTRIRDTHRKTKMNIPPHLYKYWKASLVQTATEFDKNMTPKLITQWNKVIDKGVKFISEGYNL